jgi:hypothetical protein
MADFISFDNGKTDDGTFATPFWGLSIGLAVARRFPPFPPASCVRPIHFALQKASQLLPAAPHLPH